MNGRTKLSKALVDICDRLEISVEQMAAWCHVRGRTIERWQKGTHIPPAPALGLFVDRANEHAARSGNDHFPPIDENELLRLRAIAVKNRARGAEHA